MELLRSAGLCSGSMREVSLRSAESRSALRTSVEITRVQLRVAEVRLRNWRTSVGVTSSAWMSMVIRATPDISKTAVESKDRARDPFNNT